MEKAARFPLTPSRISSEWVEQFCRSWKVTELAVFGSMARGDFRPDSDVDLLVTFEEGAGALKDRLAMQRELEEIFARKVDLVQLQLVDNPYRRYNILLDKKVLYPVPDVSADQIREGLEPFKRHVGLVCDIIDAARAITEETEGQTFESYRSERRLRLAVERLLITIGEASRALSQSFREIHPEIPWSDIIGERNILVHQYSKIKDEEVWKIATVEVPKLLRELAPLLPPQS